MARLDEVAPDQQSSDSVQTTVPISQPLTASEKDRLFLQGVRARRAERLGLTIDELALIQDREPKFRRFAKRRARTTGRSIEEILASDANQIREVAYPGLECLAPFEVEEYAATGLPEWRKEHVEKCTMCSALLSAVSPTDPERLLDIVDEVRVRLREFRDGDDPSAGVQVSSR